MSFRFHCHSPFLIDVIPSAARNHGFCRRQQKPRSLTLLETTDPYAVFRSADCKALRNSEASLIGGWQEEPEQRTANDLPDVNMGKFGMVAANAGGRFSATAWLASSRSVLLLKPNRAIATLAKAPADSTASWSSITTTCTELSRK